MGYDLFIRADPEHSAYASIAELRPLCERLHLRSGEGLQWRLDEPGRWMEVYLSSVTTGPGGGDAIDGDGSRFNRVDCHPRPLDPRAWGIVCALAATLGWEVHDPQHGERWREAGPGPEGVATFDPEPEAPRPPDQRIARDGWVGRAETIAGLSDDAWVIATGGARIGEPVSVATRGGAELSLRRSFGEAGPPAAVSADGGRLSFALGTGKVSDEHAGVRIVDLRTDTAQTWPARWGVAWLPDWPEAALAVTRHRTGRAETPTTLPEAVRARVARLEAGETRLFVIDAAREEIHALRADEILGEAFYGGGRLVIGGDGEVACFAAQHALHGFSLSSGQLLWRRRVKASVYAAAASRCGRWLAVGGLVSPPNAPGAVQVLEARTGRLLLALAPEVLGGSSAVQTLAFHRTGWLAVGRGDGSVTHVSLEGVVRRAAVLDGAVRALAFAPDGASLLAGGTGQGLTRIALLADERRPWSPPAEPSPATRAAAIRAFRFEHGEAVRSVDPEDILGAGHLSAAEKAERLAQIEGIDGFVDRVLARATDRDLDPGLGWTMIATLTKRARERGKPLGHEHHALVSRMAPEARDGWTLDLLREAAAALAPEARTEVLLARRELPGWGRLQLADPAASAEVLTGMIGAWPKGIFTELKKRYPQKQYAYGYDAKEFWAHARRTLVALGQAAAAPLRRAEKVKGPHRAFLVDVLREIEGGAA